MKSAVSSLVLAGCAVLVGLTATGAAEEVPTFTGYTRPGWPADQRTGDEIIFAANVPALRDRAIGGTIYFTVLKRTGKASDSWGSGLAKFDATFQAGIDSSGTSSPNLDTAAQYLYLYQVVNDRRTPAPILNVSVKLIVELSEITSWGYFNGVGFAVPAKGEAKEAEQLRPVSFNNVVAAGLSDKMYRSPAEAVTRAKQLQLTWVPTKLGEAAPKAKDDERVVNILWDALDPALNPNHVLLLAKSDFNQRPCFRAVWNPDNAVKKDVRSTVFGFTSNRPPTFEPARLRGLRAVKPGEIKPAKIEDMGVFPDDVQAGDVKAGLVGAEGKVPTPKPEREVSDFENPPGAAPGMLAYPPLGLAGGGAGVVGGGVGGGAGGVGNSLLTPTPFVANGGGAAASSGGGGSAIHSSNAANQQQHGNQTQTLVFNPIIINQNEQVQFQAQQEQQQQQQRQQQGQHQHQGQHQSAGNGNVPGDVVPQPAGWLLALLGLPALWWWRRAKWRTA
jgi:hypothetical protein